jgi:Ca2+-transporting ATPase
MAEIAILLVAMLAGWPLPLVPIQLLVLNLLTDGLPALALGMEKGDPDIMDRRPRPVNEPIINRDMVIGIVVQTVAISAAVLAAFLIGLPPARSVTRCGPLAFLATSGCSMPY